MPHLPPSWPQAMTNPPPSFWHTPTLLVKCFKSCSVRPSLVDCMHYTLVRLLSRFGTVPWKQRQNVTRSSPLQRCTAYWNTGSNYRIRSAVPQNPTVESNSKSIRPPVLQRYHHFQDGISLKVTWRQTRTNIKKIFQDHHAFWLHVYLAQRDRNWNGPFSQLLDLRDLDLDLGSGHTAQRRVHYLHGKFRSNRINISWTDRRTDGRWDALY